MKPTNRELIYALRQGQLLGIADETGWSVVADPASDMAVETLLTLRPAMPAGPNPTVLIMNTDQLGMYVAKVPDIAYDLVEFAEDPLTVIYEQGKNVSMRLWAETTQPAEAPAGSVGKAGTGEEQRKNWVPLFEKHNVDLVLEHHDHTFKRTKPLIDGLANPDGVLYLGDGSWGRLRSPRKADPLSVMEKTSEDYHLSLHRLQGEERFHLALDTEGAVVDIARTGQRKAGVVPVKS